jgi:hypothetical protein
MPVSAFEPAEEPIRGGERGGGAAPLVPDEALDWM